MKKLVFTLISILLFLNLAKGQDYFKLGNEESVKGNYKKAIDYYTIAIQQFPAPDVYYNRGLAYYNLEQYHEAFDDYNIVIELKPDYAETYYSRGLVFGDLNKYDEAIDDFCHAIDLKPDYAEAYYNRGNTYYTLEKYDEAIKDYEKVIKLNPKFKSELQECIHEAKEKLNKK